MQLVPQITSLMNVQKVIFALQELQIDTQIPVQQELIVIWQKENNFLIALHVLQDISVQRTLKLSKYVQKVIIAMLWLYLHIQIQRNVQKEHSVRIQVLLSWLIVNNALQEDIALKKVYGNQKDFVIQDTFVQVEPLHQFKELEEICNQQHV